MPRGAACTNDRVEHRLYRPYSELIVGLKARGILIMLRKRKVAQRSSGCPFGVVLSYWCATSTSTFFCEKRLFAS